VQPEVVQRRVSFSRFTESAREQGVAALRTDPARQLAIEMATRVSRRARGEGARRRLWLAGADQAARDLDCRL